MNEVKILLEDTTHRGLTEKMLKLNFKYKAQFRFDPIMRDSKGYYCSCTVNYSELKMQEVSDEKFTGQRKSKPRTNRSK